MKTPKTRLIELILGVVLPIALLFVLMLAFIAECAPIPETRSKTLNTPITCIVYSYSEDLYLTDERTDQLCDVAYDQYISDGCTDLEISVLVEGEFFKVRTVIEDGKDAKKQGCKD